MRENITLFITSRASSAMEKVGRLVRMHTIHSSGCSVFRKYPPARLSPSLTNSPSTFLRRGLLDYAPDLKPPSAHISVALTKREGSLTKRRNYGL